MMLKSDAILGLVLAKLWRNAKLMTIAAVILPLGVSDVFADAYCVATPSEVLVGSEGLVVMLTPFRGDWVGICNVRVAWKGVDPSICVSWFSMVANAVTQHKGLGVYYSGLAPSICSSVTTYYESPVPAYIRISGG